MQYVNRTYQRSGSLWELGTALFGAQVAAALGRRAQLGKAGPTTKSTAA
ncbi:hypothetical protein GPA27_28875 [Aromatoleum toluolicum]|nr:hypothetical protein [Aromatoleum toluolicum]MCQ6963988.1 hypothetical protein [Aromatoleum toluolicum]